MSLPCDIVLLPSIELTIKTIEASNATNKFESFFLLEDGKFFPHMSLYMFQLDEADISHVEKLLTNIANETKTIYAKATAYRLGEGYGAGYVDFEYEVSDELNSLQRTAIEAVNPVRVGMRESDVKRIQNAEGLKLENFQKYGYPAVGDLFRPHITLTKLKLYEPKVLELLPRDVSDFSGVFDRLGLFEMGENGTCRRKIAEFPLSD